MERIIRLSEQRHVEAQQLLPWYVTGRLDAEDHAIVEAHMVECPVCRAELAANRRLHAEIAILPVEAEQRWATLRGRVLTQSQGARRNHVAGVSEVLRRWGRTPIRLVPRGLVWGLVAAQALLLAGMMLRSAAPRSEYHALGAGEAPIAANAIIIFRPETSAGRLTATLLDNRLRIVDGPTSADAYLVRAPPTERTAILAKLRGRPEIVMAQPIDAAGSP